MLTDLHGILAWIPARLAALSYALAGSFEDAVGNWRSAVDSAGAGVLDRAEGLLARVGKGSLQAEPRRRRRRCARRCHRKRCVAPRVAGALDLARRDRACWSSPARDALVNDGATPRLARCSSRSHAMATPAPRRAAVGGETAPLEPRPEPDRTRLCGGGRLAAGRYRRIQRLPGGRAQPCRGRRRLARGCGTGARAAPGHRARVADRHAGYGDLAAAPAAPAHRRRADPETGRRAALPCGSSVRLAGTTPVAEHAAVAFETGSGGATRALLAAAAAVGVHPDRR